MMLLSFDRLQPSQLYICRKKLAHILRQFDPANPAVLPPIPVIRLDNRIVMTDGHTRAYAAMLSGWDEVPVHWDEDELDLEAYQICVEWCLEENITSARCLLGRLIDEEAYQVKWLDRCQKMQEDLEEKRSRQQLSK
jgi:hypothetical protein